MTMTMTYKLGCFTSTISMALTTSDETRAALLANVDRRFTGTVTFSVDGTARPDLTAEVV